MKLRYLTLFISIYVTCNVFSTNYYVSVTGDDANSGTSPDQPWATIDQVNDFSFSVGDSVFFKRGEIWRVPLDNTLNVPSSGSPSQYFYIGAYGSGAKPEILGSLNATDWTETGTSNVWVSGTNIPKDPRNQVDYGTQIIGVNKSENKYTWCRYEQGGLGSLKDDLDWFYEDNKVYLYSTSNPGSRFDRVEAGQNYNCVFINSKNYVHIDNLELAYSGSNGIYDGYPPKEMNGLKITNCHIHHIGLKGSGSAYGISCVHSDSYIAYNDIHNSGRRNINLNLYINTSAITMQRVVVEHNHLHDGWHTTGVDMIVSTANGGSHVARDITIRNNIIEEPEDKLIVSGDNIYSNPIYITADPGAYLRNVKIYNNIFRFATGKMITVDGVDSIYIYYNTMYGVSRDMTQNQNMITITEQHKAPTHVDIRNNIFFNNCDQSEAKYLNAIFIREATLEGIDKIDHNLYWADPISNRLTNVYGDSNVDDIYRASNFQDWRDDYNYDVNSPDPADPMFLGEPSNLRVKATSPAVGAAVPISMVVTDFEGNPRDPVSPTIGAFEYYVADPTDASIHRFCFKSQNQDTCSNIDFSKKTVTAVLYEGIDIKKLSPAEIILAPGATISPNVGDTLDFTNPQKYTVTAADGTTKVEWTVSVSSTDKPAGPDTLSWSQLPFRIFPNPSSTSISILFIDDFEGECSYRISNVQGIEYRKADNITEKGLTINIADLPTGMYILDVTGLSGRYHSQASFIKF